MRSRTAESAMRALDRVALLRPTYRIYEALKAARTRNGRAGPSQDGLPVPPARLRMMVAGTPDLDWFLESGRTQAGIIGEAFGRHGKPLRELERILDFGCGCGRVTRHWAGLDGPEIHGTDANPRLVRWCAENLGFGRFAQNGLLPPLPYDSETFDAIVAISVITHHPEEAGRAWVAELARVLRPGGVLALTTHGDSWTGRLTPAELDEYESGNVVVRWARVAGSNLCTAFHPPAYVQERLAPGLPLVEFLPDGGGVGSPSQDLVVFRKPLGSD